MNPNPVCSQCGRLFPPDESFLLDGAVWCASCLFPGMSPVRIWPMGVVRSTYQPSESEPRPADIQSEIQVLKTHEPFLDRLEDEAMITVVYYFDRMKEFDTRTHRRFDGKYVGVFASRSPRRPSRLAVQDVRLLKREGTVLHVQGLDALDGTPVLDIKMQHPMHHKE